MKSDYLLSVERPDRLAMRLSGGEEGLILVDDGKQFARGIPVLKKYVVTDPPEALRDVFKDQSTSFPGPGNWRHITPPAFAGHRGEIWRIPAGRKA